MTNTFVLRILFHNQGNPVLKSKTRMSPTSDIIQIFFILLSTFGLHLIPLDYFIDPNTSHIAKCIVVQESFAASLKKISFTAKG